MNYFEFFDMPVSLIIDQSQLAKKYFELQKKYHPDFYGSASEDEQAEVLDISSSINKAFKIFKNADETIKYVLQQKELLEEEEKFMLPPAFLMEMMELNEELMEEDSSATKDKITLIEQELNNDVKHIIEGYKDGVTTEQELLQVKEYYYKKKYLQRILDRLDG